ncbi:DnaJ like protein subfamily A member 4 [Astathelohania contejeani]|uniref:DnaJ like protein subfamily A member 4 n=1 Tax=Astathelohania contejeani TaxID=164912 RepID=A0ABQ7HZ07_9MICR|nr:DnaJ like protein subfamily A member 4 [Thelohania contejeani]
MGSKQSSPQSPYDILGVDPSDPPEVIKKQYTKLLMKYHPNLNPTTGSNDKVIELRNAYTSIMAQPKEDHIIDEDILDLSLYTHEYLSSLDEDEFYRKINSLFRKIEYINNRTMTEYPRFGDRNSKTFYTFYNFYKKFKSKAGCEDLSSDVRRIVEIVSKLDPRLNRTYQREERVKKKRERMKDINSELFCKFCLKEFKSGNQMINHLNSKKHFNKIKETEKNPKEYIEREIEYINNRNSKTEDKKDYKIVKKDDKKLINITNKKDNQNIINKNIKKERIDNYWEHEEFRKCSVCKTVFPSRNQLFIHIRSSHSTM